MSLGNENFPMNKTEMSAYHMARRSFGWGPNLPINWIPGGFYTQILGGGQGGVQWQNINPSRRTPAIWTETASTEAFAIGTIFVFADSDLDPINDDDFQISGQMF